MRQVFFGISCLGIIGLLDAEPQVTYVGDGRYACRGTVKECEPVQRRNDARELQRLDALWLEAERREQQRLRERMEQINEQDRSEKRTLR